MPTNFFSRYPNLNKLNVFLKKQYCYFLYINVCQKSILLHCIVFSLYKKLLYKYYISLCFLLIDFSITACHPVTFNSCLLEAYITAYPYVFFIYICSCQARPLQYIIICQRSILLHITTFPLY